MNSRTLSSLVNTFGDIPSDVCYHIKYFTYNDSRKEFTCTLCEKVIQKSAPKTLEAHMNSQSHRKASCSEEENNKAFAETFKGKIPQIVQNNSCVLDVVEEGYECVICGKTIKVSKNPKVTTDNFSYHLTSSGHEEKLDHYYFRIDQLRDIYGEMPQVVENNKEFINLDRSGKNYECNICKVSSKVNKNDSDETEKAFEKHFYSPQHIWEAKCSKVKSLIPEFQQSGQRVHTFLTRNIDYLSTNGAGFFCSLCHDNISRNINDVNETIENLKHHVLSSDHEENLFGRLNHENEVVDNLVKVFGDLTGEVLKNLRYLELNDDSFSCSICKEEICTISDLDEPDNNIFLHFESDFHEQNLSEEVDRRTDSTEKLECIFGKMPDIIEENLQYIEYVQGNNFQCILCDSTLSVQQGNRNLESHLRSSEHIDAKAEDRKVSESVDDNLKELLGEDCDKKLPVCIKNNNWTLIDFEKDSKNFHCFLCRDIILVDEGNKKEEITMQNFKSHLYSVGHTTQLKLKAIKTMLTTEKLEHIYGGVPKSILSNVQFLYENDDSFTCDACDVEIQLGSYSKTTKTNFMRHLRGSLHKNNLEHVETSIDNAFKFLNKKFGVPEFLLQDVDFWYNASDGPNIYCTLCQEDLDVDLNNLKQTRRYLEDHVDSERHKNNRKCF